MNRKIIRLPLTLAAAFILSACGGNVNEGTSSTNPPADTSSQPTDTGTSSSTSTEEIKITLTLDVESITLEVGKMQAIMPTVTGTDDHEVIFESANPEIATVESGVVTGVAEGETTITAKAHADETVFKTIPVTITPKAVEPLEESISIAEAKKKANGETVVIKGKVTGVGGTSAYISDSTGGMYIYNWSSNSDDTAITNKKWTLGDNVIVKTTISISTNRGIQTTNYSGGRIAGTYAKKITEEVTAMTPIALDEAGFKALTGNEVGNLYTFDAKFKSGTFKTGKNDSSFTFTIGSTDVTLFASKYDTPTVEEISKTLEVGATYKITTPLSYYNKAQFAFLAEGTTLTKTADATFDPITAITVTAAGEATTVTEGKTLQLTATVTPATANPSVTWSVDNETFATIDQTGLLTAKAAGTVNVTATTKEEGSSVNGTLAITVEQKAATTIPAEGVKAGAADFKSISADTYTEVTTEVSGVEFSGKLMKTGKYSPYKRAETTLDHDFIQFKKNTTTLNIGPIVSGKTITVTSISEFATSTADRFVSVNVNGAALDLTDGSLTTGTVFAENITYKSGSNTKTVNLYRYSATYDLSTLANGNITLKASSKNACYVEYIELK